MSFEWLNQKIRENDISIKFIKQEIIESSYWSLYVDGVEDDVISWRLSTIAGTKNAKEYYSYLSSPAFGQDLLNTIKEEGIMETIVLMDWNEYNDDWFDQLYPDCDDDLLDMPKEKSKEKTVEPKGKQGDGMICWTCKRFYPMAEPNQEDGTLKCYRCRNNL